MKVCVIGLGTVGYPTAEWLGKYYTVLGHDLRIIEGQRYTYLNRLDAEEDLQQGIEVYVICVPTEQVYDVCKNISEFCKEKLVIIESTMQVGSCRKISEHFSIKNIAHCPHRYWKESPIEHGVQQCRVLGAVTKEVFLKSFLFYTGADILVYGVDSIEVAEMSKLVENSDRYVKIAFVEEVKMICDELGIDFASVRESADTKWNVDLLSPRDGIKGECLPKDIRLLSSLKACTPLLTGAIETDHLYQKKVKK